MPYDWTEIGIYKEEIISVNGDLQTLPQSTEFTNPNSTFFVPPSTGNEIINPIELSDLSTTGFFQMTNPQHQTYSLTYPFGYHPKQPIIIEYIMRLIQLSYQWCILYSLSNRL